MNEILESYIVYKQTLPYKGDPAYPIPIPNDTSKGATADDLSVSPENINHGAYNQLQEYFYPPLLPFNRHLELQRTYLEHMGTNCYEVMRIFQKSGDENRSR